MSYIRPLGDTAADLSKIGAGTPLAGDPVAVLTATVNRFPGPTFPLATGKVPPAVATMALTYLQQSLITAIAAIPDPAVAAQLNAVNAAFADPTSYVNANLASVTARLAGYADSLGRPAANMTPGASSSNSIIATAVVIGGILLFAWSSR